MISIFKKIRIKLLAEMLTPTHIIAVDDDGNLGKTAYPEVGATITNTSELINDGETGESRFVQEDEISGLVLQGPYLRELVPDGFLPSTTGNYILRGSFFVPDMVITIEGHTINYQTFISIGEFVVNLTRSATEGFYDVTLNNGLEATFADQLQVVNGTVYEPTSLDWTNIVEPIDFPSAGKVAVETWLSQGSGTWAKELDYTKDWVLSFNFIKSALGTIPDSGDYNFFNLLNISDDSLKFNINLRPQGYITPLKRYYFVANTYLPFLYEDDVLSGTFDITMKWIGGTFYIYSKGVLEYTHPTLTFTENVRAQFKPKDVDFENIKYIDLSDTGGGYVDPEKLISQFTNDQQYIKIADLTQYADDAAAATGGVAIGQAYIKSSTGAIHSRLT